jgi:hypothetical protein
MNDQPFGRSPNPDIFPELSLAAYLYEDDFGDAVYSYAEEAGQKYELVIVLLRSNEYLLQIKSEGPRGENYFEKAFMNAKLVKDYLEEFNVQIEKRDLMALRPVDESDFQLRRT